MGILKSIRSYIEQAAKNDMDRTLSMYATDEELLDMTLTAPTSELRSAAADHIKSTEARMQYLFSVPYDYENYDEEWDHTNARIIRFIDEIRDPLRLGEIVSDSVCEFVQKYALNRLPAVPNASQQLLKLATLHENADIRSAAAKLLQGDQNHFEYVLRCCSDDAQSTLLCEQFLAQMCEEELEMILKRAQSSQVKAAAERHIKARSLSRESVDVMKRLTSQHALFYLTLSLQHNDSLYKEAWTALRVPQLVVAAAIAAGVNCDNDISDRLDAITSLGALFCVRKCASVESLVDKYGSTWNLEDRTISQKYNSAVRPRVSVRNQMTLQEDGSIRYETLNESCTQEKYEMNDNDKIQIARTIKRALSDAPEALELVGLYCSAETAYRQACDNETDLNEKLALTFELGQMYFSRLGLGERALACYEDVWKQWESVESNETTYTRRFAAYACENAMLLSPDINTFTLWRECLRKTDNAAPILNEIGKTYPERYENGEPWWQLMLEIAHTMYDRVNASCDQRRYGDGASVFRMMLLNRKSLRLPLEVWKDAAQEYGILTLRLCAETARNVGAWFYGFDGYENAWHLREALPLVCEYSKVQPGDIVDTDIVHDMKENIALGECDHERIWTH